MTPNRKILHSVFSHRVAEFAERIAVVDPDTRLTYAQLDALSDHIADFLIHAGARREDTVALYCHKGVRFVAAMLGCMKAGCRFMALDPTYPAQRLTTMLDLQPAALMVTTPELAEAGPARADQVPVRITLDKGGELARLDHNPEAAEAAPRDDKHTRRPVEPTDPCYVVFTSGSTGTPKGVLGSYQGLSHFAHQHAKQFEIGPNDRFSQLAPVGFDACFKDIFVPLLVGGSVIIPRPDILETPRRLLAWIGEQGITTLQTVPSVLRLLLAGLEAEPAACNAWSALKRVVLAGEPLFGRDIQRCRAVLRPEVEIANLYGLTETTILKTCHRHVAVPDNPRDLIHVGMPISNTAVLIVKGTRLCDIGRIGEIYIKSPFLTLGYLDQTQTDERFVVNPLTGQADDLVFRTGDLGRYGPNREIIVLGRQDNQVKVNGVRVDLGDIEQHLLGHDAIRETAVVALKNKQNEIDLACYFTAAATTDGETLRNFLAERLPAAMIPGFFMEMEQLPLSLNGKVNRKALPQPEAWLYSGKTFEEPRGDVENQLAEIWKDILALEKVSATIPFFETGGHSLKATRILARVYRQWQVDISLRAFFEHDTIRGLAALVEQAQKGGVAPIPRVAEAASYPASHAQYRLWVLDQMDEDRTAYSMPGAYHFSGPLNLDHLQTAFTNLIQRHESLRTTFQLVNGDLHQIIHPRLPGSFQLTVIESEEDHLEVAALAAKYAGEDTRKPFDLAEGPLLRVTVVQRDATQAVVIFNVHHIVCDGASVNTLGNEWIACYRALQAGKTAELAPLTLQYKDFAAWQKAELAGEDGQRLRTFWHERFRDIPVPLAFPTDLPRPSVPRYAGKTLIHSFSPAIAAAVVKSAGDHDLTRFQWLTAAVFALLHRSTGQTDVVLGSPVSGRPHPDLEDQVGFYVNMLALRQSIEPEQPFAALAAAVKQTVIAAGDHQNYPFDKLVDELDLERENNRAPLFDVMVALESPEVPQLGEDGLTISELAFETGTSRYDLLFVFVEEDDRLSLKLNYNTDLFRPERIQHLAEHVSTLLAAVTADASIAVGDINLLNETAHARAMAAAPGPKRVFPLQESFAALVQSHAKRNPEATALIHNDRHLSYGALLDQAQRVAVYLRQQPDFAAGDPIGLRVTRGEHAVIGLLGTLLAGGVFLPLDPFYPAERVTHMQRVGGCRLLLGDAAFPGGAEAGVRRLELETAINHELVAAPQAQPAAPDKAAALIFTSGSTGVPKGIWVQERGLVNTAFSLIEQFGVEPADRVLQFAAYSFDIFLAEVFTTLCAGATLVVADRACIDEPDRFHAMLADQQVTVGSMPTAYLNALNLRDFPGMRVLITGGEAPNAEVARHYAARLRYFNAYGLTEASAYSTVYEVEPAGDYRLGVPIGKPLANTELYLLDAAGRPTADGLIGEMCIAGTGLARGYAANPELTAARFVPHPFRAKQRLLRTGDLARRLPDGNLLFLGRADSQVKIRGHRVEPGEVSRRAAEHAHVAEAFVLKYEPLGELVAYVIPEAGNTLDIRDLKTFMAKTLPTYMVPTYVVLLDQFPLSSTGKIDTQNLPDPREAARDDETPRRAARSLLDIDLLAAWSSVLGRDDLSIDDDFFAAGGTSILVVKLTAQIQESIGKNVTARDIFLHPTVAELADRINDLKAEPIAEKRVKPGMTRSERRRARHSEALGDPVRTMLKPSLFENTPTVVTDDDVTLETRLLSDLILSGDLAPVKAVTLENLADESDDKPRLTDDEILGGWFDYKPVLAAIRETPWGRIGVITLPRFDKQLFTDPDGLRKDMIAALEMAAAVGADTVSMTGLLPAATEYGALLDADLRGKNLPRLTTGHDAVIATMSMTVAQLLERQQRDLPGEKLALIGLDAVGIATLGLVLEGRRHPAEILVCDPENRDPAPLQQQLEAVGYQGRLTPIRFDRGLPPAVYTATLMIGTTTMRDAVEIEKVKPGTLIVSDSGRQCFHGEKALVRIEDVGDIQAMEGDVLRLPGVCRLTRFVPRVWAAMMKVFANLEPFYPHTVTGCVMSSLLLHLTPDQDGVRGAVTLAAGRARLAQMQALGITAAEPHISGKPLESDLIQPIQRPSAG